MGGVRKIKCSESYYVSCGCNLMDNEIRISIAKYNVPHCAVFGSNYTSVLILQRIDYVPH